MFPSYLDKTTNQFSINESMPIFRFESFSIADDENQHKAIFLHCLNQWIQFCKAMNTS